MVDGISGWLGVERWMRKTIDKSRAFDLDGNGLNCYGAL